MKLSALVWPLCVVICLSRIWVAPVCLADEKPVAEDAAQFKALFNGNDLSGWQGNKDLWTVRDDMIVGKSAGIRDNEFLVTDREFGDFELRLDFRLRAGQGNSGVQFRSKRVADSKAVTGYQADIGQQYWGCLYDEHRRNKILAQAPDELNTVLKKDDWNSYVIRAVGNRIVMKVNGLTTVDYREHDADIATRGIIALQIHSGPAMNIAFKNIRIREMDKTQAR